MCSRSLVHLNILSKSTLLNLGQDFLDMRYASGGGGAVVRNQTVRVDVYYEVLCPDSRSDHGT